MTYNPKASEKLKKDSTGRYAEVQQINSYEAKQKAILMIRRGRLHPQSKLYHLISLLGTAGVLLEKHLLDLGHIAERTLRRYRKNSIIDLVPTPLPLQELLDAKRIWTLGPVGLQLAKLQFDLVPTGYLESKIDNITHDVLCNYVYVEILKAAQKEGATALLKSRYEVALRDFRDQQILQPDAMIILENEKGEQKPFLVEYHHEDSSVRAPGKVKKYEYVYTDVEWQEQWNLTTFPPILIVTTHKAPAVGYKNDIEERSQGVGVRCRYLVKSLKSFLEKQSPLVWLELANKKTVKILP